MISTGAKIGAVVGASVAIVLITLTLLRPFPWYVNGAVEKMTFRLCPLFMLGFASGIGSMTTLIIFTILANAILYAIAFTVIAAIMTVYRRLRFHAK